MTTAMARRRLTPPLQLSSSSYRLFPQGKKSIDPSHDHYNNITTADTSSLIQTLSRSHRFGKAWDVFESMKKCGLETLESDFNVLIRHYCEAGKHSRAIYAIERMTSFGVCPSSHTYNTLLTHLLHHEKNDLAMGVCRRMIMKFAESGQMQNAMCALDVVKEKNLAIDVATLNALIHAFSKSMNMNKCLEIVAYMKDMGITPDAVTHRHIISGFCAVGKLEDAIGHLENMKNDGLKPEIGIYSALIYCFCNLGRINEGCVFFNELIAEGTPVDYSLIYSVLVSAYCKDGQLNKACVLGNRMLCNGYKPLVSTQSLIILRLCEVGKFEEARYFNDLIEEKKCRPNIASRITTTSFPMIFKQESLKDEILNLLSVMISKGYAVNAFQTHNKIGRDTYKMISEMKEFQVGISSHMSLLKRLCGEQRADYAHRVFREMLDNGFVIKATTYSLVMNGAIKMGNAIIAMDLFLEMRKKGFEPEPHTYNQLIHSLCKIGRVDDAFRVFNDMKSCRDARDHASFTTMITGLCTLRKVEEACEIFLEMVKEGFKPHLSDIKALFPSHNEGEGGGDVKVYLPLLHNLQQQRKPRVVSRVWEMMESEGVFIWIGV